MRHVILIAALLALTCKTGTPKPETRILDAGRCWFEIKTCGKEIQFGERVFVSDCSLEWMARCRGLELERYMREGCTMVRMPDPTKIAVSCGGKKK